MNALSLIEKIACLASQDRSQIEWMVDRFLASPQKKGCDCHVIDPRKVNILVWINKNPKGSDSLVVKIADQRFIGLLRSDKHGAKYWKVRDFYENEEKEPEITQTSSPSQKSFTPEPKLEVNQPLNDSPTSTDRLAKFQERQAKAQQLQNQKEPQWIEGKEFAAQLDREKAEKKAQVSENIPNEIKENANNPINPSN